MNQPDTAPECFRDISMASAFRYWLKLGFLSFGGPAGQIAMMHEELIVKRHWISESRFLHALNYCMLLPGPEATQLAIYIGWLMHNIRGGIMAGLCFILPGFLVLTGLSWLYLSYGQQPLIAGLMYGVKPAIIALVLAAAWRVGKKNLTSPLLCLIAILSFLCIVLVNLPFPLIVAVAALVGWLRSRNSNGRKSENTMEADSDEADDLPEAPPHTLFNLRRLLTILAVSALLLIVSGLLLFLLLGPAHPLTQMAWLFTKTAFLSFGGAYSVLPYVFQAAADQFHWLTTAQMMDGLALGETTPGPLIMVVAFVGFLGGWQHAMLSHQSLLLTGVAGASVACFFTFLPSFIFILAGGPLVEWSHRQQRLSGLLSTISAAVVGVILSLAVFFARHLYFGASGQIDYLALLMSVVAVWCVFRLQMNTIRMLALFALWGIVWNLVAHSIPGFIPVQMQ